MMTDDAEAHQSFAADTDRRWNDNGNHVGEMEDHRLGEYLTANAQTTHQQQQHDTHDSTTIVSGDNTAETDPERFAEEPQEEETEFQQHQQDLEMTTNNLPSDADDSFFARPLLPEATVGGRARRRRRHLWKIAAAAVATVALLAGILSATTSSNNSSSSAPSHNGALQSANVPTSGASDNEEEVASGAEEEDPTSIYKKPSATTVLKSCEEIAVDGRGEGSGVAVGAAEKVWNLGPCVVVETMTESDDSEDLSILECETLGGDFYSVKLPTGEYPNVDDYPELAESDGRLGLDMAGAVFDPDTQIITLGTPTLIFTAPPQIDRRLLTTTQQHHERRRLKKGAKTVLVVRVTAAGITTTQNEARLSDSVFGNDADGNGADPVTLKSQYAACSNGQLQFNEAADRNGLTSVIRNGVTAVSIPDVPAETDRMKMRNSVTEELKRQFAVTTPQVLADFVMYCLPPGTAGLTIGEGVFDGWLSWYNNDRCSFSSTQMHEIGHNLNIHHARDESATGATAQEYGDQSGVMGFTYRQSNTLMCFNAANFYQMEWFNGTEVLELTVDKLPLTVALDGFVKDGGPGASARIIKLSHPRGPSNQNRDLYALFNWGQDYNTGTREGKDKVVVVQKSVRGDKRGKSFLVGKLGGSGGETYAQADFGAAAGGSCTVSITTTSIDLTNGVAMVDLGASGEDCPTPAPTGSPTVSPVTLAPTENPTKAPTRSPTTMPTANPVTPIPTRVPTVSPTLTPTKSPTKAPTTDAPSPKPPTPSPSKAPTEAPTLRPTSSPTSAPSHRPSVVPTARPTAAPTLRPTLSPSLSPSQLPSGLPSVEPSANPTRLCIESEPPSSTPTARPTSQPTTEAPTEAPATPTPVRAPTPQPTFSSATDSPTTSRSGPVNPTAATPSPVATASPVVVPTTPAPVVATPSPVDHQPVAAPPDDRQCSVVEPGIHIARCNEQPRDDDRKYICPGKGNVICRGEFKNWARKGQGVMPCTVHGTQQTAWIMVKQIERNEAYSYKVIGGNFAITSVNLRAANVENYCSWPTGPVLWTGILDGPDDRTITGIEICVTRLC